MPPIGDRRDVVRASTALGLAVADAAEVSLSYAVRLSLRSEPQPDFAIVRAEYTQRDEVTEGTLPLPALTTELTLADLF